MNHPLYGNTPPDLIAEFEAERATANEADRQRIAAGKFGDIPDDLTEKDEWILNQAWRELAEEEALQRKHKR